jgi:hypothetical protein
MPYACSFPALLLDNGKINSFFLGQFLLYSTIIVINDLEHFLHVLQITDKSESVPRADYP